MCSCCKETKLCLEVGKTYLNRMGEKITILENSINKSYPFKDKEDYDYTVSGSYYDTGEINDLDLISEYKEPTSIIDLVSEVKPKYTTVEGHEIIIDSFYELRNSEKVKVCELSEFIKYFKVNTLGATLQGIGKNGIHNPCNCYPAGDIMRPWVEKKPSDIVETGRYIKRRDNQYIYSPEV